MGLGSAISRSLSVASSSNYEPSHWSSSVSTRSTMHPPDSASGSSKASTVRSSTVTSATSMSSLIRSASTTSTLRPPTCAPRTSETDVRASTITSATSTSNIIRSASTASTVRPQASTPATSTTNLSRSASKCAAPSYISTAASRLLWGRPPPGHSTIQPSQISALTNILSLPLDTPMLCSLVGALGVPLSRNQFSPTPNLFCDAHFWFEQKHIDELTEVIAHEIGPQLDKLRTAPKELISKKTRRLLSILKPYKDIFTTPTDTSRIASAHPTCPACTLSHFFQNPTAVAALTTCVKGRKHRAHPWPVACAWLDPCPGKGADWNAKWRHEGKPVALDRIRVQRWRRDSRAREPATQEPQVLGHGPGEGCDFCDALRVERAHEAELDGAIAEEEEEEEEERDHSSDAGTAAEADCDARALRSSDSETVRAMREESIIRAYARPTSTTAAARATDTAYRPRASCVGRDEEEAGEGWKRGSTGSGPDVGGEEDAERRASERARSYERLVGRRPERRTGEMLRG